MPAPAPTPPPLPTPAPNGFQQFRKIDLLLLGPVLGVCFIVEATTGSSTDNTAGGINTLAILVYLGILVGRNARKTGASRYIRSFGGYVLAWLLTIPFVVLPAGVEDFGLASVGLVLFAPVVAAICCGAQFLLRKLFFKRAFRMRIGSAQPGVASSP